MNREFIDKMLQAKKLEKEAWLSVLPESQRKHLQVIGKEMGEMLREYVAETVFTKGTGKKESKAEEKTVKKVIIE